MDAKIGMSCGVSRQQIRVATRRRICWDELADQATPRRHASKFAVLYVPEAHSQLDGSNVKSTRSMVKVISYALLVAAIVIAAILGLYKNEVSSTSYASYDEAMSKGAIGIYKWLPSIIPKSAYEINESHDVDSNEVWFALRFDDQFGLLPDSCFRANRDSIVIRSPRGWDRFPDFVRKARSDVIKESVHLYRCHGESYQFFLAIDEADNRAIGWSNGS